MTHKKQIVLDFYSYHNLGDDLFVETFAKHFSDCEIHLLINPKCVPQKLPDNVRILHFSHVDLRLRRISNLASHRGRQKMVYIVEHVRQRRLKHIANGCDAFVKIGGSIFMQHAPGCTEIDFSTEEKPDFSFPGKSATLEELPSVTLEDVLYNYQNNIIADCTDHHRYAVNQFSGLESYLNEKESAIESSIV